MYNFKTNYLFKLGYGLQDKLKQENFRYLHDRLHDRSKFSPGLRSYFLLVDIAAFSNLLRAGTLVTKKEKEEMDAEF